MSDYVDHIAAPGRGCAIVAHRGAWHDAPENSLPAIERAVAAGYDIVEIDVRRSADGHLFLMHDETLARMTGDPAKAESNTLLQLRELYLRNADGGAAREVTDERIPTLQEALETARGRIFVDLDLKDRALFGPVGEIVRELGMARQVDLKASVDTEPAREWLAAQADLNDIPFMAMARFNRDTAECLTALLETMAPFMCEIKFDALETIASRKERFARAGIALWANTLDPVSCCGFTDSAALDDPDAVWGQLMGAGVSVIQTDEPEALKSYLEGRGA